MATEKEIGWATAFLDSEGSIVFAGESRQPRVSVTNTDTWMLEKFLNIVGIGKIRPKAGTKLSKKPIFEWSVQSIDESKSVLRLLYEDLSPRRKLSADLVFARVKLKGGTKRFVFGDCCRRGHLLSPSTAYIEPSGKLVCRECKKANVRNWRRTHTQSLTNAPSRVY